MPPSVPGRVPVHQREAALRAFVVGLGIGGLLGLGPGCSDASCRKLCNGCCDAFGNCISMPDNRSSSSCGLKGAACVDCAASGGLCELSTLTCVSDADAGPRLCGCTLPNGACAVGTTTANCGADAGVCLTCDAGMACSAGACVVAPSEKRVGSPCVTDPECQETLGLAAVCKLETTTGSGAYVGGYCTLPCASPNPRCPGGSTCVGLDPQYGEYEALCWDNCLPNGGDACRPVGYRCYAIADAGTHGCWISPMPVPDAGPAADKVGRSCDAGVDCQNPPDRGGVCLGVESDRHWVGGYCSTASCASDSECSADGGAVCASFAGHAPRCLRRCALTADGGSGDGGADGCRLGYLCQPAALPDGGAAASGVCSPGLPPPPERTGAACSGLSDCLVPPETVATCLPEAVDGGGASGGFPGGMCTRLGCRADDECGLNLGAVCQRVELFSVAACLEGCVVGEDAGCRAGYACRRTRLADGGVGDGGFCWPQCDAQNGLCP